ncbi:Oxidoreductase family, C-terminal alpha/beta domain [Rhizoctonia solani]|uniref:Oxidoreductase family, C-terminal alpha/beta domain n=1 Tax=Rhizoctonia solani TaxID=456999 RepID=A0A8H7IKJ5_9AGAM|nr:Oxidoreductase family, C-terminal alpha/beta domain [Rhizoctonia solani]
MDPPWLRLEKLINSEENYIVRVEPRYVAGAGRGLFATQDLAALETVISVPSQFLMNARTLSAQYPEPILPQSTPISTIDPPPLSSIQLLSLHLYRVKRGIKDDSFDPYISTLPPSFADHPLAVMQKPDLRPAVMKMVPPSVENMLLSVEKRLKDDWNLALRTMEHFPDLLSSGKEEMEDSDCLLEDYMWAWLNVNTRCLYHGLGFAQPSDNVTMCPILDFANHTSIDSLSITQDEFALGDGMAFSTPGPIKNGDQVYLRYGGHSNAFLFSEYGFVLPLGLQGAYNQCLTLTDTHSDWTFHVQDGEARPSYRVIIALRLLHVSINSEDDSNHELQLWEDSIMGLVDNVSEENELKVRQSVIDLCKTIVERSKTKISYVRSQVADREASGPVEWLHVLDMIEQLWEEEYYVAKKLSLRCAGVEVHPPSDPQLTLPTYKRDYRIEEYTSLWPSPISMVQPIKTGVIGVGSSAVTFHVPFLLALPNLFEVYSVLERKATDEQKKSGGTIGAKFNTPAIRVIITTPNETHYPFAKAAIQAKKHVLLEKPVTPTYAEAKELDSLAKSQGVILSAFQNRRWDSDFLTLKKLVSEGKLGDLVEFESRFDRYRPSPRTTAFWREAAGPGAGHTFDLGPHLIDQVLQLFGRPNRLTASIQNLRGFGGLAIDDTPYPIRATVAASSLSVKKSQLRFSVRGSKGSYEKRGLDPQEDQLKARKVAVLDAQFGREDETIAGILDFVNDNGTIESTTATSEKGSYQSLFENLAGAIASGADLQVKFEQSAAVIQMIELAMLSSKEGRTVEVPAP